jgi:hypothetical protein
MKKLKFIQACPDDDYYIWQVHLWLESLRERGLSKDAVSLVFTPDIREFNQKWKDLETLYPESEFKFYKDVDGVSKLIRIYIPILRPYVLMRYFKEHPELEEKAIFYCDSDVLFTENFNIDKFVDDNICYLSNTLSYINATYWDSKGKVYEEDDLKGQYKKGDPIFVLKEKFEEYKKRDILQEACSLVGISREIAEKNNLHSGGAQYLLKNIDYKFWEKVITDCIRLRIHLQEVNKEFFVNENKGFQGWCSDMWAVLWNLWLRGQETRIVPEMDFAWSTDPYSKLEKVGIFHNAGISGEKVGETPVFYKGKYHLGLNPFEDNCLDSIYNIENKTLCNHFYVEKMIDLKNKYKL